MSELKKTFYLLIVFFIILVGWYFIYNYVFDNKMAEVNDDIIEEQKVIALKVEQINQTLEQEEDLNKTNYYRYIPKESGIPNVLDFFSKTAKKYNINIEYIDIDNQLDDSKDASATSGLANLSIRTSLIGDYLNIRSFLNEVYSGDRLLNLISWQWNITDKSNINIYLTYEAYYYPNNYEGFIDLPAIPMYKPADRIDPLGTVVEE